MNDYDASLIKTLSFPEHIRKRPGMYIGDTDTPSGAEHVVDELLANVLDLFLADQATRAEVTVEGSRIVVEDDGPGLPFDVPHEDHGISQAEQFLTHMHQSATATGHAPHVHLASLGVGLAVVCALGREFEVHSWRHGQLWHQRYELGAATGPPRILKTGEGRGTLVRVDLDREIFAAAEPRSSVVRSKILTAIHLFPGFQVDFNGERFHSVRGLADLAFFYYQPHWSWRKPFGDVFHLDAHHGDFAIQAAVLGQHDKPKRSRENCHSWVNGVATWDHGSHVQGLFDALRRVRWSPRIALLHVVMLNPIFAGPVRDKLANTEARQAVRECLTEPLRQFLEGC